MGSWSDFYFLCGSSAEGLTGLMFVSITFGSKLVAENNIDRVNVFFSSICFHFVQVFLLCCIASIPTLGSTGLGICVAVPGLYRLAKMPRAFMVLYKASQSKDGNIEASDWVTTFAGPTIFHIGMIAAGLLFYYGNPQARNLFAFNLIGFLGLGVWAAWDMIVWVAAKVDEPKLSAAKKESSQSGS